MHLFKVVLDTNALLRCISRRSLFAFVLDYLYTEKYELCLSTDIYWNMKKKSLKYSIERLLKQ